MEEVCRGEGRLKNQLKREEDGEEGGEKKTEVGWRVRGGKGKCWSPMVRLLYLRQPALLFLSGTQIGRALPQVTRRCALLLQLLQLCFSVAWPVIYSVTV